MTNTITFAFWVRVHLFNGLVATADGFGVIQSDDSNPPLFLEETIISVIGLAQILRKIHFRLLNDGYIINETSITKPKYEHQNSNN